MGGCRAGVGGTVSCGEPKAGLARAPSGQKVAVHKG